MPSLDTRLSAAILPKTVVVIDDEQGQVDVTAMLLESAGHIVFGSKDSAAGLDWAIKHGAEVLVLDYEMPSMDGAEVGRLFRRHTATQDINVLMYSGTPEAEIRSSFAGYDGYLAKSVHPLGLIRAVQQMADRRRGDVQPQT
jgi:CheY-like chemotaxis protein